MPLYPPVFDLSDIDGSNGFRIDGEAHTGWSGMQVAAAGDINGDGFADIILSTYYPHENEFHIAAESYVVFGSADGFDTSLDLATLDGSNGFRIAPLRTDDINNTWAAGAGDLNGDGFDDIVIGPSGADPYGISDPLAGAAYIIYGQSAAYSPSIDAEALDGANGFKLTGFGIDVLGESEFSALSVSSAGDFNGDGIGDLLIGAGGAEPGGQSYVVFGNTAGFGTEIDVSTLDGSNGFRLDGGAPGDTTGFAVSGGGDINGDGFDDVIVGGFFADPNGLVDAGSTYVVFGTATAPGATLDLTSLDGSNGFRIDGLDADDVSGFSVSMAGDVNGDGYDDLIIGAMRGDPHGHTNAGESYVILGSAGGFGASFDVSTLDGSNGFIIRGDAAGDESGYSVSRAGDLNGDGFDDLLVGTQTGTGDPGKSYVIFGELKFNFPGINLSQLNGTNGFVIEAAEAGETTGSSVSAAGDLNGDGYDDLIVGGREADGDSMAYVIYGVKPTEGVRREDGPGDQTLSGGLGDDRLISWAGNDHLIGDAGDDHLYSFAGTDTLDGGVGNDTYYIRNDRTDIIVDAGGIDTVYAAFSIDLDDYPEIENIVMDGNGARTLSGNSANNSILANTMDNMLVGRDGNDRLDALFGEDVLVGGMGRDILIGGGDNDRFDFYAIEETGTRGGTRDVIMDFDFIGDVWDDIIHLGVIDADTTRTGNQAFAFVGEDAFSGEGGELRFFYDLLSDGTTAVTIVEGDVDGDGVADFQIELRGTHALSETDFIL